MKILICFLLICFSCSKNTPVNKKIEVSKSESAEVAEVDNNHDVPCDGEDEIEKKIKEANEKSKDEGFDLSKADEGCAEDEAY